MGSDIGLQLVAVVVALAVPAYLSLSLRCYVRSTHEVWGLDDLCMLFAAVSLDKSFSCCAIADDEFRCRSPDISYAM